MGGRVEGPGEKQRLGKPTGSEGTYFPREGKSSTKMPIYFVHVRI